MHQCIESRHSHTESMPTHLGDSSPMSSSPKTPCLNTASNMPAVWYLRANALSLGKKPICRLTTIKYSTDNRRSQEQIYKLTSINPINRQTSKLQSVREPNLLIFVYGEHVGLFNFVLCPFWFIVISRRLFNVQSTQNGRIKLIG